ncbi:unnamed protein product [Thlaspi arvense]|uniref:Uncharacterized protein n=1 Tax=Thlaspi arvense TaxID=13288 RepID=A0AAU9RNP6_THLAR|nr:unnamed protein product [Thlaspi arvense]
MASLEMVSTQMFECNKKEKDLKVLVRDRFDAFPVDNSGSNQDGKSKDVLECSSRSSVSETEESLQTLSSNSSPLETNSNLFYNPGQPENPSRNEIIIGASYLVQIWEARSQHSISIQNQSLIDSRTSSGLSLSENSSPGSFFESPGEEIDWFSQSDKSYVTESGQKEREARISFPPLVRIRGKQAFDDFSMMILSDRKKDLKWLLNCNAVSKFSSRGFERLQVLLFSNPKLYMLRIRSFERYIAIQEIHWLKSASHAKRSFRVKKMLTANETAETMKKSNQRETQETVYKPSMAKKAVFSEDGDSKKPEVVGKATDKGEGSDIAFEKAIVKESVEKNKTSLSILEKVSLWDSKDTRNKDKAARRVIDVEDVERNKERAKKEEEGKSMEIEEFRINPQENASEISLDERKEEESESPLSRESGNEEESSQDDEETSKAEKQEESEAFSLILESPIFINGWDESEMEDEDYIGEIEYYDWVSDISRPRSYWEDLRKQRELEVIEYSKKDDIRNMINTRTVSSFLASDFREDIDRILISQAEKRLQVEMKSDEKDSEEWMVDSSARYQEKLEENETEEIDLETVTLINSFSQYRSVSDSLKRNSSDCFEMPVDSLVYRCGHELQWSSKKCPDL